jgi:EAL domain-containing protein (putative c-di-GMP-specific phosphodiesterase class I)
MVVPLVARGGLSAFCALQPEIAKLDMSLIRDVDRTATKQRLVRSLAEACRDLDIHLIAEGVETEAELATLVELGCDHFQGYLFGRPGSPPPAVHWPDGA